MADPDSIFAKTPGELTDDELHHAIVEVHRRRNEVTGRCSDFLAVLLGLLCDERDARRHLRWAVDNAVNPFYVITAGQMTNED